MQNYEYDVALSFAGEDREHAKELAELLRTNGYKVFYDKYERTQLWGKDLYRHLSLVYKDKARYCVMFVSEHYAQKLWTNHELRSAQARAFQEREEYILPVRLDNTEIPGIPQTVGYLDLREMSITEIYQVLVGKLSGEQREPVTDPPIPESIEGNLNEFVLLGPAEGRLYFFPFQDVRADSSEISLELLPPESPEDEDFLRTLQQVTGDRFYRRSPILPCAYRNYAAWVKPQEVVETTSGWEILLELNNQGQNFDPFSEMTVNGISPDQIAEMRARRILLDEKVDPIKPGGSQPVDSLNQETLEFHIRGSLSSPRERRLEMTSSPIPGIYRQWRQTPERFKKFARLISVLYLRLSNTVDHILQLDMDLLDSTQLRVRFRGRRPRLYDNVEPAILEFEGICSLSE